jgi:hypothetical protein
MVRPGLVTRDQVLLAAKTAIAAGVAWVAALAADPHSRPYFAPLAVLLVVRPTVYDSLSWAFQRVAGVVVGVTLSAMLASTASVHAADDTFTRALARVQERWGSDPARWFTFGMTLAVSQRILAGASRPIDPAEREPA